MLVSSVSKGTFLGCFVVDFSLRIECHVSEKILGSGSDLVNSSDNVYARLHHRKDMKDPLAASLSIGGWMTLN